MEHMTLLSSALESKVTKKICLTPSSTSKLSQKLPLLSKFKVSFSVSLIILGLPWIVDYHMMNNKRYVLTVDSAKVVKLWECETGKCIQEYTKKFSEVK